MLSRGDAAVLIPEQFARVNREPAEDLDARDQLSAASERAAALARLNERDAAHAMAVLAIGTAKTLTWADTGDLDAVVDASIELARGGIVSNDIELVMRAEELLSVIRPEVLRYPPSMSRHPPSLGFSAIARGLAGIARELSESALAENAKGALAAAAEKAALIRTPVERAAMYFELTQTALRFGDAAAAAGHAESAAAAAKTVTDVPNVTVQQGALTEAAGALYAAGIVTGDDTRLTRADELVKAAAEASQFFGRSTQSYDVTVGVTVGVASSSKPDVNRLVALFARNTKDEADVLRSLLSAIEVLDRQRDRPLRTDVIKVAVQRTLVLKDSTVKSESALALLPYAGSADEIIQLVAAVGGQGPDARARALSLGVMAVKRLGIKTDVAPQ